MIEALSKESPSGEKIAFCKNSKRWLIFMDMFDNYPKTCYREGECDDCACFEERIPTKYLLKKIRGF